MKKEILLVVFLLMSFLLCACQDKNEEETLENITQAVIDEDKKPAENTLQTEEDIYTAAMALLNEEEFGEAKDMFASIGEYSNSSQMVKECLYQEVCWHLKRDEKWVAYEELVEIYDYKDSYELMVETAKGEEEYLYRQAKELYEEGNMEKAKRYFSGISGYEDAPKYMEYLTLLEELEGVYVAEEGGYAVIRDGYWIDYDVAGGDVSYHEVLLTEYCGRKCLVSRYHVNNPSEAIWFYYVVENDGDRYIKKDGLSNDLIYEKIDYITEEELRGKIENHEPTPEPYIGMVAEEVGTSTWGEPIKVKEYSFETGVREQWIYLGNRYIYIEDGVVTGIQKIK